MKLRQIKIQNFKSIEDATIEDIGDIDILCGRNNSGKSAIFEALNTVRHAGIFASIRIADISASLFTGRDFAKRIMNITLIFEVDEEERSNAISRYCETVVEEFKSSAEDFQRELLRSAFFKKLWYEFRSFEGKNQLCLHQIRITGTDGNFGTIAKRKGETANFSIASIVSLCQEHKPLTSETLENATSLEIGSEPYRQIPHHIPFELFQNFMQKIYSFSPFRESQRQMRIEQANQLTPDGKNLVQRLFTMKSNEDENWIKLQEFVKVALLGIGTLQARQIGDQTETHFRDEKYNIEIDLHDMGTGIEQMLMIASVLISYSGDSLILTETPEHHLHPGAQRTLLQFIRENLKGNQILISTHSPIFLSQRDLDIHIVSLTQNGTKVLKAKELADLSKALDELGSRNSDVLLADFVLFVEGQSDERILRAWAKTLDIDFDSLNIFCITIGGSRNFDYYANSDILHRISLKSPVPYLFVIDRDEKSNETIRKIQEQVKNLHIFERREIENYLLSSRCVLEAMRIKAKGNLEILQKLKSVRAEEIDEQIASTIDGLKHVVLMKRIKEELGGATFLPNGALESLIQGTKNLELNVMVDKIYEAITRTLNDKCSKERLRTIVEQQFSIVDKIWMEKKEEEKKKIVFGEDILQAVFERYGLNYDKVKDGERIAQQMEKDEIPHEIKSIIKKLAVGGQLKQPLPV